MAIPAAVCLAILTRAPRHGGKTRLFEALGCAPDPALLEALLLDTIDATETCGLPRVVFVTPAEGVHDVQSRIPGHIDVRAQAAGDLGERMQHAFDTLLGEGVAGVVLIGSDLPLIAQDAVVAAARLMREQAGGVVLGPASDGGYYLIGSTRTPSSLFRIGGWGGGDVLARTLEAARADGIVTALVESSHDVDTPDDLRAVMRSTGPGQRTRVWARKYFHEDGLTE